MTELRLHRRTVHTVFDLMGVKEDDITYSLGWALSHSDKLVDALLHEAVDAEPGEPLSIALQQSVGGQGRTDVEVETENVHLVLEAKRGWNLPTREQLEQYVGRFDNDHALTPVIAVVAECSPEWARPRLPDELGGVPVIYIRWSRVAALADQTAATVRINAEKHLLREFVRYLKGLMSVQNVSSNMVYVVALNADPLTDDGYTFVDIVVEDGRYFHPLTGTWPKTPPNYLGFRYGGQLQQICHVDDYELTDDVAEALPRLRGFIDEWEATPRYIYRLGPPIKPSHRVSTGGLYGPGHHRVALDLLLTSQTIREARDRTQERLAAVGEDG